MCRDLREKFYSYSFLQNQDLPAFTELRMSPSQHFRYLFYCIAVHREVVQYPDEIGQEIHSLLCQMHKATPHISQCQIDTIE
jgi:hypothetical protein